MSKNLKDSFLICDSKVYKETAIYSFLTNLWRFGRQGKLFLFHLSQLHSKTIQIYEISHGLVCLSQSSYTICTNFPSLQLRAIKLEWPWWGCTGFWSTQKISESIYIKALHSVVILVLPTRIYEVYKDNIKLPKLTTVLQNKYERSASLTAVECRTWRGASDMMWSILLIRIQGSS